MNIIKIDGRIYDVLVTELSENFNILYSDQTGRTIDVGAEMFLDPLGTFYGHKITFARKGGKEREYDLLFEYLSKPRNVGVEIEAVHGQDMISYSAYVSSGERQLRKVDINTGKVIWGAFSANFIPMKAQVEPL